MPKADTYTYDIQYQVFDKYLAVKGITDPYRQCGYFKPEQDFLRAKEDNAVRLSKYYDAEVPKNMFSESTNVEKIDAVTPLEKTTMPKRNGKYHKKTQSTAQKENAIGALSLKDKETFSKQIANGFAIATNIVKPIASNKHIR